MRDTFKDKLTMGDRQTKKQGERERKKEREKQKLKDRKGQRGENKKHNVLKKKKFCCERYVQRQTEKGELQIGKQRSV